MNIKNGILKLPLKVIEFLGKDRFQEFKSYYEIDPKRKSIGYGNYYIQDYLKGVAPNKWNYPDFDTINETFKKCLQSIYNFSIYKMIE